MTQDRAPAYRKWQKMREVHLLTYPECRACGEAGTVVHHLRYRGKRGESERPGDLITMCSSCHDELHRLHHKGMSLTEHSLAFVEQIRAVI